MTDNKNRNRIKRRVGNATQTQTRIHQAISKGEGSLESPEKFFKSTFKAKEAERRLNNLRMSRSRFYPGNIPPDVQTTGSDNTSWNLSSGFVPVSIKSRMLQDRLEAGAREKDIIIPKYSHPKGTSVEYTTVRCSDESGDRIWYEKLIISTVDTPSISVLPRWESFENVTWQGFGEGFVKTPARETEKAERRVKEIRKKPKYCLSYLVRHGPEYGIYLTRGELSREWTEYLPNSVNFNDMVAHLKTVSSEDQNRRMKMAAAYVDTKVRSGTVSETAKAMLTSRSRDKNFMAHVSTLKGINPVIPQTGAGSHPMIPDVITSAYGGAISSIGRTVNFPLTGDNFPLLDLLNVINFFLTDEKATRVLCVLQFFKSVSWNTICIMFEFANIQGKLTAFATKCFLAVFESDRTPEEVESDNRLLEEQSRGTWSYVKKDLKGNFVIPQSEEWIRMIRQVRDSPLIVKVLTAFAKVLSYGVFDSEEVSDSFAASLLNKLKWITSSFDDALWLTESIKYIVDRFRAFTVSKNLDDLFELGPEAKAMTSLNASIENVQGLRDDATNLQQVLTDARNLIIRTTNVKDRLVQDLRIKLNDMVAAAARNLDVSRKEPLGVIIRGPAGGGKTTLVSQLGKRINIKEGYDPDINVVQTHTSATKHQLLQGTIKVYFLNDIFQTKDEKLDAGGHLPLLQGLVDSAPYRVDAASIEDKKLSAVCPDYVICTTNSPKFEFTQSTTLEGKLDRRYIVIHQDWTTEFMERYPIQNERIAAAASLKFFGCCTWKAGYMRSTKKESGNSLEFSPRDPPPGHSSIPIFTNPAEVIIFMEQQLALIRGRGAPTASSCPTPKCGLPLDSFNKCIECDRIIIKQGGAFSVNITHGLEEKSVARIQETQSMLTKEVVEGALKVIKTMGGIILAMGAIREVWRLIRDWSRKESPVDPIQQGALVSRLSNVKKEEVAVQRALNKNVPWLVQEQRKQSGLIWNGKLYNYFAFLTPTLFVTVSHFFNGMVEDEVVTLTFEDKSEHQFRYFKNHVYNNGHDLAFVYVPNIKSVVSDLASLLSPGNISSETKLNWGKYGATSAVLESMGKEQRYFGQIPTQAGDCGMLIRDDNGRIYAMHIGIEGLFKKRAVATPLNIEEFKNAIEAFYDRGYFPARPLFNMLPSSLNTLIEQGRVGLQPKSDSGKYEAFLEGKCSDGGLVPVCHLSFVDKAACNVEETRFKKRLEGKFGFKEMSAPFMGKAIKVGDVWCSPTLYALRARGRALGNNYSYSDLREASNFFIDHCPIDARLEPLDFYRTVCGDELNDMMNPRDNSKSAGYTLRSMGLTNNQLYQQAEDGTWQAHDTVIDMFEELEAEIDLSTLFTSDCVSATIKSEVMDIEKVKNAKARIFYVGEHVTNLMLRKYLLPILAAVAQHPFETGVNICMNCVSPQWKTLCSWFEEHSIEEEGNPMAFAGDFKEYDLSHYILINEYIYIVKELSIRYGYSSGDTRRLVNLLTRTLVNWLKMPDGNWFLSHAYWFSGRTDTIFGNCIMGRVLVLYSAITRNSGKSVEMKCADIRSVHTGDDLVASWKGSMSPTELQEAVWDLGYVMTDANKNKVVRLNSLYEVEYLKRTFLPVGGRVYAPLSFTSIYKALAYRCNVSAQMRDTRDRATCQSMVREAFMHGEPFFNEIREMCVEEYPDAVYPTFEQLNWLYGMGFYKPWD